MVGKICTVCRRCSYVDKQLSFFTYPGDPLRRHEWLIAVNRLDLMVKLDNQKTRGNHRICEMHFDKKYVRRSKLSEGRKYLSKDAFPTLSLGTSNINVPMSNENFFLPPSPTQYTQNIWRKNSTGNQDTIKTNHITRYNLRPIKQESRFIKHEEESAKDNMHCRVKNELYVEIKSSTAPPLYEDASQFCESVIKVSQSTQTPVKCVLDNNKRTLDHNAEGKRPKIMDDSCESTFLQMCSTFLSPSLTKLVKWNLSTANGKEHVNFTLFALNLYYSSNLYNLLRDMLSLPSRDSLKYFLLPKTTKLSKHFLNAFQCKINNMSIKERICSLSVGSIMLKPNIYYDIKYDRIIGFQDINGIQNIYLAKYAVLLMVQGILENWRQPIAYAFISEYDNTPDISLWIDEVLSTLIDIGLDIRAFVSDPRSEFLYESESRFVTPEKTYFTINGTDIFYLYDTSQLFKIVRNNLKSCDFYYDPNCNTSNNVEFFEQLNNLCNVLNAKMRFANCQYKRAFGNKSYQKNLLNHMLQLFQNLKIVRRNDGVDVTENMKFIESFRVTINSVIHLFEDLNYLGVKYLLTSRLNHNSLDRFFAYTKQGHCKEECTPRNFHRGFVRRFVFNMLKKPLCGKNIENSLDAEEFSQQLIDEEVQETESISHEPLLVHTTDYRDNLPDKNAFVFICGYCYLKCIQVHCCDTFQYYLNGFQNKAVNNDSTYLCSVSLDLNVQNCKMLPPDDFTEFLMLLESKFKEYFKGDVYIRNIGQGIMKEFEQCDFGMPCPCFPIDYLKALFVRVRLFYTIRKNNKLLKKKKCVKSFKAFSL